MKRKISCLMTISALLMSMFALESYGFERSKVVTSHPTISSQKMTDKEKMIRNIQQNNKAQSKQLNKTENPQVNVNRKIKMKFN